MSYINKIAFHQGIRSEVPNQELAKELSDSEDRKGIKEIASFLYDKNSSVASDCIKVLYEIGYLKPKLIQDYYQNFIDLLSSKNNRMVWGGMIGLATVSELKADEIMPKLDFIVDVTKKGTVITQVWGVYTLIGMAKSNAKNKTKLMPVIYDFLENSRPVDLGKRLESMLALFVTKEEKEIAHNIVQMKMDQLSEAQSKKVQRISKKI